MFKDLSSYAFVNAKIRSRIGRIYTDKDFEDFRKEGRYEEMIRTLVEKEYLPREKAEMDTSILNIEFLLFRHLIDSYRQVINWENEDKIKKFIRILLQRLEIKNLKDLLRVWHKKDEVLLDYIYKEKIIHDIPTFDIYSADTYDQVLDHLKETPYYEILLKHKEEFTRSASLFLAEVDLDRYAYELIFNNLKLLNRRDSQIVKKFYGLEADLTNFSLLFRFKNYYSLDHKQLLNYLIPFGQTEKRDLLAEEIFVKEKVSFEMFDIFTNVPSYIYLMS